MKISKKAFPLVLRTFDLFLKTLAAGLVNSFSKRQDIQILLYAFVIFC